MLVVQLESLQISVHFGVLDYFIVPLLVGTLFINRFVKRKLPMEPRIVPIRSHSVTFTSKYTSPSDPLAVLQKDAEFGTCNDDGKERSEWKSLLTVVRRVASRQNTK